MAARSRGQIRSPERPQTIDAARSAQSSHRSSRRRHAGQLTQAAALTGHPPGYPDTRFRRPAPRLRTPTRRQWPARSRPANRNPRCHRPAPRAAPASPENAHGQPRSRPCSVRTPAPTPQANPPITTKPASPRKKTATVAATSINAHPARSRMLNPPMTARPSLSASAKPAAPPVGTSVNTTAKSPATVGLTLGRHRPPSRPQPTIGSCARRANAPGTNAPARRSAGRSPGHPRSCRSIRGNRW